MPHPAIELHALLWLASLGGRWPLLDRLAETVANNDLFEAVPYVLVMIAMWHCHSHRQHRTAARRDVVAGALAAGLAVLVCRIVQNAWDTPRPIWDPALGSAFAPEFHRLMDDSYHSFPSDHAAFLLPLAWTVYRLHRGLGAVGAAWLVVVCAVRSYLGLHYPVDLLGGLLLGTLAVRGVDVFLERGVDRIVALLRTASQRYPGLTAAALFLLAFQYATLFVVVRDLGHRGVQLLSMLAR